MKLLTVSLIWCLCCSEGCWVKSCWFVSESSCVSSRGSLHQCAAPELQHRKTAAVSWVWWSSKCCGPKSRTTWWVIQNITCESFVVLLMSDAPCELQWLLKESLTLKLPQEADLLHLLLKTTSLIWKQDHKGFLVHLKLKNLSEACLGLWSHSGQQLPLSRSCPASFLQTWLRV